MKPNNILCVFLLTCFLTNPANAADVSEEAKQGIRAMFGETAEVQIKPYKDQLLEITVGPKTLFASLDGKYIFSGPVFDTDARINLVEQKDKQYRQRRLSQLAPDMYLSFPASTNEQHAVTVFTDIDCGYCRKLHREMQAYNDLGISVRYLFFPRSGPDTDSWAKAEAVWCAESRQEALTAAKNNRPFKSEECEDTPVTEHYALVQQLGLRGTPAIFTPGGQLISGYLPADELLEELEEEAGEI